MVDCTSLFVIEEFRESFLAWVLYFLYTVIKSVPDRTIFAVSFGFEELSKYFDIDWFRVGNEFLGQEYRYLERLWFDFKSLILVPIEVYRLFDLQLFVNQLSWSFKKEFILEIHCLEVWP